MVLSLIACSLAAPSTVYAAAPLEKESIACGIENYADSFNWVDLASDNLSFDGSKNELSTKKAATETVWFKQSVLANNKEYLYSMDVALKNELAVNDYLRIFLGQSDEGRFALEIGREYLELILIKSDNTVSELKVFEFSFDTGKAYNLKYVLSGKRVCVWIDSAKAFDASFVLSVGFGIELSNASCEISDIRVTDYRENPLQAQKATLRYSTYTTKKSDLKQQAMRLHFALDVDANGRILYQNQVYKAVKYGVLIASGNNAKKSELTVSSNYAKINGSDSVAHIAYNGEFTAYLYDISSENAQKKYAFRPYINAVDTNGEALVIYGETQFVSAKDIYEYYAYEEVLNQYELNRITTANEGYFSLESGTVETVYVSETGSNSNSGSDTSPVRTLSKAIALVKNGGTVVILDKVNVSAWLEHKKQVKIQGGIINFTNTEIHLGDNLELSGVQLTAAEKATVFQRGYTVADNNCVYSKVSFSQQSRLTDGEIAANAYAEITDVFHEQAYIYISPLEPTASQEITVRIRTVKGNVTKANIEYAVGSNSFTSVQMKKVDLDKTGYYDYFEGVIPPQSKTFYYRFKCSNEKYTVYLDLNEQVSSTANWYTSGFIMIPTLKTPDWAKAAVVYSMPVNSFYNGTTLNDYATTGGTFALSADEENECLSRYGGDFEGLQEKMSYIADEMGAEILSFNPVWKSDSGMGYGATDYNQIDSSYGNEQDFAETIAIAHDYGLKVVLDAVLNFASNKNIWFNKSGLNPLEGAFQSTSSPFYDLFYFESWPNKYNNYWGGIQIDYSNELPRKMMYQDEDSYIRRYLNNYYDADGWRLDIGGELWGSSTDTVTIMQDIRNNVKAQKSDALLISEWATPDQLKSGALDGQWCMLDMMQYLRDWISEGKTATEFASDARLSLLQKTRQLALCCQNYYESHDHRRMYDGTEESKAKIIAARLTVMNFVGSPWIYYGSENGAVSEEINWDAFNWNETTWDYDFYNLQKALNELRQEYSAVKTGAFKNVKADDEKRIYAFGRWDEDGTVLTIANQNTDAVTTELDVRQLDVADGTVLTDYFTGEHYIVANGKINVLVNGGGTVLVTGKAGDYIGEYKLNNNEQKTEKSLVSINDQNIFGENLLSQDMSVNTANGNITYQNGIISNATNTSDTLFYSIPDLDSNGYYRYEINICQPENVENNNYTFFIPFSGKSVTNCMAVYFWKTGVSIVQMNSENPSVPTDDNGNTYDNYYSSFTRNIGQEYNVVIESTPGKVSVTIDGVKIFDSVTIPSKPALFGVGTRQSTVVATPVALQKKENFAEVYKVKASGRIGGIWDTTDFALKTVYNKASLVSRIDCSDNGKAVLALRGDETQTAAEYMLVVGTENATVYCRQKAWNYLKKVCSVNVGSGRFFRISREESGIFKAFYSDNGVSWKLIKGSECAIDLPQKFYAGFACIKGTAEFSKPDGVSGSATLFDDFSGDFQTCLSQPIGQVENVKLENAKLKFSSDKIGGFGAMLPTVSDWTAKALLSGNANLSDGEYFGVSAFANETDFVSAGRYCENGKQYIYFGKTDNGMLIVKHKIEDIAPQKTISVQLQRIGTVFTAVYCYEGEDKWYSLGDDYIFANYSTALAGIAASAKKTVEFESFCFGESDEDGASYNTPKLIGEYKFSTVGLNKKIDNCNTTVGSGNFSYELGGIRSNNESGISLLNTSKTFEDFRADTTFKEICAGGFAGYLFCQSSEGSADGYALRITSDRAVSLYDKETLLKSVYISKEDFEYGRVILQFENGKVTVYTGEKLTCVLQYDGLTKTSGYFSYIAKDTPVLFSNYNLYDLNCNWSARYGTVSDSSSNINLKPSTSSFEAHLIPIGFAATEMKMELQIFCTATTTSIGESGILFKNIPSLNKLSDYKVALGTDKCLVVKKDGKIIKSVEVQKSSVRLSIVLKDGKFSVYIDGVTDAVCSWDADFSCGATPILYSSKANAVFGSAKVS